MEYHLNGQWLRERSVQREALIDSIDGAEQEVTLPESTDIQQGLDDNVGTKPDSPRRAELFPAIIALGSQTLKVVDLVLIIQSMVDKYKDEQEIPVPVIEDEMVPQYLSVVAQGIDKPARAAIRAVWREIRDARYPKDINPYERRMANQRRFNPKKSASLRQSRGGRS